MWHTSRGDRTLRGEEAALVMTAIDGMIDALMIHIDEELEDSQTVCESGITVYDAFSPSQRIGLLHEVAKHLLTTTETALPLSAALDSTVAAIFVDIRDQVAIEIDFLSVQGEEQDDHEPSWRRMVLAAYKAVLRPPGGDNDVWTSICKDLPDEWCTDMRRWERIVDSLSDAILWDRDFELAESFLDVDPGVSHQRRRLLGINDDYFTRVAPDPHPEELFRLISRTRDIVRVKPR